MGNPQTQVLIHRNLRGLNTSTADPAPNTALNSKNMVRHRIVGNLGVCDGYGLKFDDAGRDLPQIDDSEAPNYLDPAIHFISNLVWENIHNFFVPDHGGQHITVATATYRKTSVYDNGVFIDRFGIWVRPYWSGVAWVDEWLELTEIQIEKMVSKIAPNRLRLSADEYAVDQFVDWIGIFEDYSTAQDHDNYILITATDSTIVPGFPPTSYGWIEYFGANTDLNRADGSKIILARSFFGMELPAAISTHIYSLLNEARLTTGNQDVDIPVMIGFRNKNFGWTNNKIVDKLIAEKQTLDLWRYAWGFETPTVSVEADDPIATGKYRFATTVVTDDGQETELRKNFKNTNDTFSEQSWIAGDANFIATDNGFIYALFRNPFNGDLVVTLKKYRVSDLLEVGSKKLSVLDISDASVSGPSVTVTDMQYSGGYLYIVASTIVNLAGQIRKTIFKIDTEFTAFTKNHAALGTSKYKEATIDGDYIYVCATDGFVYKIKKDFTTTASVDLSGQSTLLSDIVSDGTFVYIGTYDAPAKLIKIQTNLTFVATLVLSANSVHTLLIVGAKLFATTLTAPGQVLRVSIPALTEDAGAPPPYIAADDYATGIAYDGTSLFVVLNPSATEPLQIVNRLDPTAMTVISTYVLTNGTLGSAFTLTVNTKRHVLLSVGAYLYINGTLLTQLNTTPDVFLESDGAKRFDLKVLVSPTAVTDRFSKMRVYVDIEDAGVFRGLYLLVKEISFEDNQGVTWEVAAVYNTLAKHFYTRCQTVKILGSDINEPGPEVSSNIDRASTDNGAVKYTHGAPINGRIYLAGVRKDGVDYPNKLFASANHGDGSKQFDVFPTDKPFLVSAHVIDLEYNDGDEIRAVAGVDETIVAIKRRSIIAVKQSGAEYRRRVITRLFGIAAPKTLVAVDYSLYWLDYSGAVIRYNTSDSTITDFAILEDLRTLANSVKEAAVAAVDRINRQYRLAINGVEYILDLDDNEWMIQDLTDTPARFAADGRDTVDFLSGGNIFTLSKRASDDTVFELFNDGPIDFEYEMNENPGSADENHDEDFDLALKRFYCRYISDIDLTLTAYKNGEASAMTNGSFTLSKNNQRVRVKAPSGDARCSSYRLKIGGTKDTIGQSVLVKRLGAKYEVVMGGGDTLVENE